jgi:hypothetical protein
MYTINMDYAVNAIATEALFFDNYKFYATKNIFFKFELYIKKYIKRKKNMIPFLLICEV